jgi:hypothetical protein
MYLNLKKMKYLLVTLSLLTLSCTQKEFKYKIHNPKYLDYNNSATFFTDTVQFKSDTAFYINSDNSIVIISIDSLKDCKIDTLK